MKTITAKLFLCAFLISSVAFSQGKVKEKHVIGTWKLHMNLEKKAKEETKDKNLFERALVKGIIGTVDELIKEADITFHFKKDHTLEITQNGVLGDEEETSEIYEWKIDKKGRLITSNNKGKKFKFNNNSGWMLKKGKLVPVDDDNTIEENVWMQKVKK